MEEYRAELEEYWRELQEYLQGRKYDRNFVEEFLAPPVTGRDEEDSEEYKRELQEYKTELQAYKRELNEYKRELESNRERFLKDWYKDGRRLRIKEYISHKLDPNREMAKSLSLESRLHFHEDLFRNSIADPQISEDAMYAQADEAERNAAVRHLGYAGLIIFQALPETGSLLLDMTKEIHRHSIAISAINAHYRLDLARQLSQTLRIYFEGGIKPGEIAELALLATSAATTTAIAADALED